MPKPRARSDLAGTRLGEHDLKNELWMTKEVPLKRDECSAAESGLKIPF